jgi:sugar phosphate isomerase/epimerase
MVQFAFSSLAFYDCSVREIADFAAKTGYDGVELRCKEDGHLNERMTSSELNLVRRIFEDYGLKIFSVSGYSKFTDPDSTIREKNLSDLCRHVEIAHRLGAASARSIGGKVPFELWSEDYHVQMLGNYLRQAAEKTEGSGVDVLLETHDNFSPARIAVKVLQAAGHPRVSLLWDVIHPLRYGEAIEDTWDFIKGNFRHVHFKDASKAELYGYWPLKPLGDGEIPLRQVAGYLITTEYQKVVSIEWEKLQHPEIADSDSVMRQGLDYLRKIFNQ